MLIYPVYAIMMGERGVSPFQLAVLLVLWSTAVAVLEVPSGTVGDRFSRRGVIVVSGLAKAAGYLLWLWIPSFVGFLAGFLLWGAASSLRSGTAESLLHDTLVHQGRRGEFERLYGRGRAAENAGGIAAFLTGGWMAGEFGYFWPLALSGAGPVTASLIALIAFRDVPRVGADNDESDVTESYWSLLLAGLHEARSSRSLLRLIGLLSTGVVVAGVADEFIGPLLHAKGGVSLAGVGVAYAAVGVGAMIGGLVAHRVSMPGLRRVSLLLVGGSAFLWAAVLVPGWAAAVCMVVFFAVFEAGEVLLNGQLQRSIEGPSRATITSLSGLGYETFGVVLLLVAGIGAELGGWPLGMLLLAFVGTVSAAAFAFVRA